MKFLGVCHPSNAVVGLDQLISFFDITGRHFFRRRKPIFDNLENYLVLRQAKDHHDLTLDPLCEQELIIRHSQMLSVTTNKFRFPMLEKAYGG
tara:strand:- start:1433 stop:1711 length:279 start_codon:yes stop_codon:yes gene_type:complete